MKNRLKDVLKQERAAFGTIITIGHPDVAELIDQVGFDWVLFDMEHAPLDIAIIENLMQAMDASRTVPLIRVAWNDPVMVKRALDIGAHGVVVPWVNDREEAIRAVQACKYPPEGVRGYGPRRAALADADYVTTANREVMVAVQIETGAAVQNIDDILSVEGVDVAFIGPYDLSMSLGVYARWDEAVFVSAMKRVLDACLRKGVTPGVLSQVEWQKRLREGFRMITLPPDYRMLKDSASDLLTKARDFEASLRRAA